MSKFVLITGGLGFIGSHTCAELLQSTDYDLIIIDNLINSKFTVLDKLKTFTNLPSRITHFNLSLTDFNALENLFTTYSFECVIHFAALKSVAESIAQPLKYYENNI